MERKLLFIALSSFIFFASCSAEDIDNFSSKPIYTEKPDTISTPENEPDVPVVVDPVVTNIVVAHRGAWKKKNLPQNSIASLKEAIRLKCKGSEFDIVLTYDDSLVVCHDHQYNNLGIQEAKYADLITLKLSNGEKLPTLREYILAAKSDNESTLLFCELKSFNLSSARKKVFAAKTEKVVKELDAQKLIVYISFDYDLIKQLRILNSASEIQYLNGDKSPDELKIDNMSGIDYNYLIYKNHPDWIEKARINSINLGVWTVNDVENMDLFLKNKFNYITTDEPELLLNKRL